MRAVKRHVCGLDIRRNALCMARYSPEETAVTSVVVQPLDSMEQGDSWWRLVASEVKKLAGDGNLKGADVVCSLPFEAAVIKIASVDADEDDVDGAIAWELDQHILGGLGEYVYDYQQLPAPDGNCSRYLAVAYKNEGVKRLSDLVKSQKMNPLAVDLDMFGLVNVFEANYAEIMAAPAVLAFIENSRVSLVLTRNGMFVDYETVAASLDADRSEQCIDVLCTTLARLQRAAPWAFAGAPPPIYGAGPLLCSGALANALMQGIPGFQQLNPFKRISVRIGNVPQEDIQKFSPQLSIAVGLAVRGGAEIDA